MVIEQHHGYKRETGGSHTCTPGIGTYGSLPAKRLGTLKTFSTYHSIERTLYNARGAQLRIRVQTRKGASWQWCRAFGMKRHTAIALICGI